MGVSLARLPNSDDPLRNSGGYDCHAILVRRTAKTDRKMIGFFLQQMVTFLNTHKFTKNAGLEKARNFIHYREHPEPHFKPDMRKLGDMVKLSDAINFLWRVNRNIFNQGAYRQRPNLMKAYFNPPYNQDLSDSFGFPLEGPREGQESHRANHV